MATLSPSQPPAPDLPDTSPDPAFTIAHDGSTELPSADTPPAPAPAPDIDALVAELRASLTSSQTLLQTQATRLSTLTDVKTELSQLKDQYAFLAAAKEAVEKQLQEEKSRREQAEENVELLRGQVEQARRGVGILQKQEQERKRLSHLPLPTGQGHGEEEVLVDSSKEQKTSRENKRQSIIIGPGTAGRSHRRQSSNSEHSESFALHPSAVPQPSTSPNLGLGVGPRVGGLRELKLGSGPSNSGSGGVLSPTSSNFFEEPSTSSTIAPPLTKRVSSNNANTPLPALPGSANSSPSKATTAANEENYRLKSEVLNLNAKLAEAEEARQASESCLKALREFMAGGGQGDDAPADEDLLKNIRLPPLPTDKDPDEDQSNHHDASAKKAPAAGGWAVAGFKLWKQGAGGAAAPNSPALSTTVEPPATPADRLSPPVSTRSGVSPLPTPGIDGPTEGGMRTVPSSSTPLANFVSGWTKGVSPGTPAERPPAAGRTLTSFFSRGGKKEEIKEVQKEEDKEEKELPARPDLEQEDMDATGEGLEPSPEIADKAAAAAEVRQVEEAAVQHADTAGEGEGSQDKRASATTGTTGPEDVVATPESALQEISLDDAADKKHE